MPVPAMWSFTQLPIPKLPDDAYSFGPSQLPKIGAENRARYSPAPLRGGKECEDREDSDRGAQSTRSGWVVEESNHLTDKGAATASG